jgi:hypothetical protein
VPVAVFVVLLFTTPRSANAQSRVYFSSAPSPGTLEPIGQDYYLTVQAYDEYQDIKALGVNDVTTGGRVLGWKAVDCGPGAIHVFTVVNQAPPPPGWSGFLWQADMQSCLNPTVWFSTYSAAGLYPI